MTQVEHYVKEKIEQCAEDMEQQRRDCPRPETQLALLRTREFEDYALALITYQERLGQLLVLLGLK